MLVENLVTPRPRESSQGLMFFKRLPQILDSENKVFNSLSAGRCDSIFESIIFKLIENSSLDTYGEIALWWMPQKFTIEKLTFFR